MKQTSPQTGHSSDGRFIGPDKVKAIGLGCASLTFDHADDPARGEDAVRTALEEGVTLLDTAFAYTTAAEDNHNERLIRRILHERPDAGAGVLLSTKGGHFRDGDTFPVDGRPASLRRHCEMSLRALGVERIDLYHLHWPDPAVAIGESVATLEELRREGKIGRIGVSNVSLPQLLEAEREAEINAVQNRFSLFDPGDREVLEHCAPQGIAYLAYSPLRGLSSAPSGLRGRLSAVAEAHHASVAQVALAWLLAQSTRLIPIVGGTRPATVRDAAAATALSLTTSEIDSLSAEAAGRDRA
jgi:aryl-alcohol dehydrogenase-like predicted oxidoreductase